MSAFPLLCCLGAAQAPLPTTFPFALEAVQEALTPAGAEPTLKTKPTLVLAEASASPEGESEADPATQKRAGNDPAELAREPAPVLSSRYSLRTFLRQTGSIPWRLGGATVAITATGVANWDWGSSPFHFKSEGWFGRNTSKLGMDKLGHAWSSYVLTEFFTDGIDASGSHPRTKSYTAGILAMGLMTYIEVFDGYSKDHGFSPEDLTLDLVGTVFSIARRSIPGMREKVDFRLLYIPTSSTFKSLSCFPSPHCDKNGGQDRSPVQDYTNQRYLMAFKLAGFGRLRETPLRLIEVHAGYYARGFTEEEQLRGEPLRRRLFAGIGLNVGELLFPRRASRFARGARSVLEWIQLPYTALHTN